MLKKVLVHVCCGVCAYGCIERLKEEGFVPAVFFFNPNIHPQSEYQKRKQTAEVVAKALSVGMIEGDYEPSDWQKATAGHSQDKEGQKRCLLCYRLRIEQTFQIVLKEGYDYFTTALSISPHKSSLAIIEIGREIGKDKFLAFDFKKQDGFKKSIAAAKSLDLYCQNYCGCRYSLRNSKDG
ncbi:MAG: epoxyqueuosine reductase QueH [Candidatus Omnitrophota bacterium]